MNLEIPEIKKIVTDGHKLYSVTDSLKVFAPNAELKEQKQNFVYLEMGGIREPYSDEPTIAELIAKLKPPEPPPEKTEFDKTLDALMKVPKPKGK
jgi:hypothetical protein